MLVVEIEKLVASLLVETNYKRKYQVHSLSLRSAPCSSSPIVIIVTQAAEEVCGRRHLVSNGDGVRVGVLVVVSIVLLFAGTDPVGSGGGGGGHHEASVAAMSVKIGVDELELRSDESGMCA